MRLLQLTSDNSSFKTIKFKPGLNIVTGTQLTKEQKKSINGIGKSMSLTLVHYMFGAKFKDKSGKRLRKYLSEYGSFTLTFLHNNKSYTINKKFSQTEFYLNEEKILQTNYPKKLNELFLGDPDAKPSFRQIFNCYARRYSSEVSYYSNVLTQQARPLEDYHQRYSNLALLGIDLKLVERSHDVKGKISKLKKAKKVIEDYEEALDNSNINDIKDEIKFLNEELDDFIIAENFDKLKKESDNLTLEINIIRNNIYFNEGKLRRKEARFENSNNIKIDIGKVKEIFEEASFFFEDKITKRLEEAQKFHKNLILNRKKRLSIEIRDLKISLEKFQVMKGSKSKKRDTILKDLNNSGALEERDSLKDRITTLETEKNDLEKYKTILDDFKKDESDRNVDEAVIKQESISYLEKNQSHLDEIEIIFRNLVKKFYDNQGGSFMIEESNAQYLFNINSHIPKEGAQGVGEVKIFCYDVLLYLRNKTLLHFLAHDGCIFSEMDLRQRSTIFKVILELTQEDEFQYFINVGDDTLKGILDKNNEIKILTEEEKEIIQSSIILELFDKAPADSLFGETFD